MSAQILIPVSVGELFDKISILRLKLEKLSDEAQLASVRYELERLESVAEQFPLDGQPGELMRTLSEVNALLWDIEDQLREMERRAFPYEERAQPGLRLRDLRGKVLLLSRYSLPAARSRFCSSTISATSASSCLAS
jgi:hypothetical protein